MKKRYLEISKEGCGGYLNDLADKETHNWLDIIQEECKILLEEGSIGDNLTFKIIEMDDEEVAKLEEFQGW